MKQLFAGEISVSPSKPHSGLLGILVKHREQLEPHAKISGNVALHLLALARAIVEAIGDVLDHKDVEDAIAPLNAKMESIDSKIEAIIVRLVELEARAGNEELASLRARVAALEEAVEEQATKPVEESKPVSMDALESKPFISLQPERRRRS